MNPSYEGSGSNVPGSAGNVSGDNPVAPSASNGTPGVRPGTISSGSGNISRQPTGGRPMGNNMMPSNNIVSNDDIVIDNGGNNNRKRNLMVIGAIFAVVMVVLAAVLIVTMGRGSGGSGIRTNEETLFSTYAKYLLGVDDYSEYDSQEDYAVQLAFYDNDTQYFDQLGILWNDFYAQATDGEKYSDVSKIMGDINYQNELMDFITRYMATTVWTDDGLLQLYLDDGLEKSIEKVNANYTKIADTIYAPGKVYAEALLQNAKIVLNAYSEYYSLGCIANETVDFDCLGRNSDLITSVSEDEWGYVDENLPMDVVEELIKFAFRINEEFRSLEQ